MSLKKQIDNKSKIISKKSKKHFFLSFDFEKQKV